MRLLILKSFLKISRNVKFQSKEFNTLNKLHTDLFRNDIPCEEDKSPKKEYVTDRRAAFEDDVRTKVIIVSACLVVLILLIIASCILNSQSRKERRYHSEIDSSDYIPIIDSSCDDSYGA